MLPGNKTQYERVLIYIWTDNSVPNPIQLKFKNVESGVRKYLKPLKRKEVSLVGGIALIAIPLPPHDKPSEFSGFVLLKRPLVKPQLMKHDLNVVIWIQYLFTGSALPAISFFGAISFNNGQGQSTVPYAPFTASSQRQQLCCKLSKQCSYSSAICSNCSENFWHSINKCW